MIKPSGSHARQKACWAFVQNDETARCGNRLSSGQGVVFMHDKPFLADLAQTDGQSKIKWFTLAVSVDISSRLLLLFFVVSRV